MLVKPSGNARDESRGYKHRRDNQGYTDDGTGEFLHGSPRCILGRQAFLDVALYTFDDYNGIVHHQADGQHQPEQRERIDRETE